mmetsp:Transcript_29486/g.57477  ORF Transcript_29486/g.57477 Transcript_29486/m.57477 type:complete len:396 (+) Transcript_29486:35-1222(+)
MEGGVPARTNGACAASATDRTRLPVSEKKATRAAATARGEAAPSAVHRVGRLGGRDFPFRSGCSPKGEEGGSEARPLVIGQLRSSADILERSDAKALGSALAQDGYLYLPGALPREKVLEARARVLAYVRDHSEGVLEDASSGALAEECKVGQVPFMEGRNEISHSKEILRVVEGPEIHSIFRKIFGEPAKSMDYKWLRGIPRGAATGAHMDYVYMCRGSPRLLTAWVPLGDTTIEMGTLVVCESSNQLKGFQKLRDTYGKLDMEAARLKGTGWFTEDPRDLARFGGNTQWRTTDFKAGDLLIFGLHTLHMSTCNVTSKLRLSIDVRFQPASDPMDTRYFGEDVDPSKRAKAGLRASDDRDEAKDGDSSKKKKEKDVEETTVTMAELKKRWGFLA